jgi:hypothetical protein
MNSHVRHFAVTAVAAMSLAAPTAHAANPVTLTDVGSAFSPPLGVATADSAVTAAGSFVVVNGTPTFHTYAVTDLVSGAAYAPVTLAPNTAHTYSAPPHTVLTVQQVSGLSQAVVLT